MAAKNVKFYRGKESTYLNGRSSGTKKYQDGIYFATDTNKIYLNDKVYGQGSYDIKNVVKDVVVGADGIMTVTFVDGSKAEKTYDLKAIMSLVYEDRFVSIENRIKALEDNFE